jgi:6-phosphogluconate dehydrogenase
MGTIFDDWNKGELDSFLIEITGDILKQTDPRTSKPFVDIVLDAAGQKGTGKWTSINALEMGVPAPTVAEAVFARCLSAIKEEREVASKILNGPKKSAIAISKTDLISAIRDALYCSKICSYAQGFQLMKLAGKEHGWTLDFASIAKIWRAGCIIRAVFLQSITQAFERNEDLDNLLLDEFFAKQLGENQQNWRRSVANAALIGVPVGAISSSLSYYDSIRTEVLPANLLQGQRDFFGAHTFLRTDIKSTKKHHVKWSTAERKITEVE